MSDFVWPPSPAVDDQVTGPYGEVYTWNGVSWGITAGGGGGGGGGTGVSVGNTPPASPGAGNLWWDTVSVKLYMWNGLEWVIVANVPEGGGGGTVERAYSSAQLGDQVNFIPNQAASMRGLGLLITPLSSGMLLVFGMSQAYVASSNGILNFQFRYGTGTPPVEGATPTGNVSNFALNTAAGYDWQLITQTTTGAQWGFGQVVLAGLTPNTEYWIDMAIANVSNLPVTMIRTTLGAVEL